MNSRLELNSGVTILLKVFKLFILHMTKIKDKNEKRELFQPIEKIVINL